jgi:hypothetical protein
LLISIPSTRFLMLLAMNHGVLMEHCLQTLLRQLETRKLWHLNFMLVCVSLHRLIFLCPCSHEYQMIMSVVWKRINDTGKNWRHVYKVLIRNTLCSGCCYSLLHHLLIDLAILNNSSFLRLCINCSLFINRLWQYLSTWWLMVLRES